MTADQVDLVPFGKYKGRPVFDLIADRPYTDWLAAQPWFRQRYGNVYNLVVQTGSTPQDTPEHNAMQARFLDHDETIRLARPWLLDAPALADRYFGQDGQGAGITTEQHANLHTSRSHVTTIADLTFETGGWDLTFTATTRASVTEVGVAGECTCSCTERCMHGIEGSAQYPRRSGCYSAEDPTERRCHCAGRPCPQSWAKDRDYQHPLEYGITHRVTALVELKPTLGDDYPTVLRKVMHRMQTTRLTNWGSASAVLVVAGEFTSAAVDLDRVRKIFRSQAVSLFTTAELAPAGGSWACACDDCAS